MTRPDPQNKRERRDRIIIIVILVFGFVSVGLAGQWAVRFKPVWRVALGMDSNIDPNQMLTGQPQGEIPALDPDILTKPAWLDNFLTPQSGASQNALTSLPGTPAGTQIPNTTTTPLSTGTPVSPTTAVPTLTAVPSNTPVIYYIPPSNTPNPPPSNPTANLQLTMSDGGATYTVGGTITYTITIYNLTGPNAVTGATVTDTFPASLSNIIWSCSGSGGGTCSTPNGAGNLNAHVINLPVGSSITYIVNADINPAATGNLVNTATVASSLAVPDPNLTNNTVTDTDTPVYSADLSITKTDGSTTYNVGGTRNYTITVYNLSGPSNVTSATVTDTFPGALSNVTWTCSGSGGGTCTANGSGNLSDTASLPVGSSVTYLISSDVSSAATGNLVNTASVGLNLPSGITDPNSADNTATDTDTPVYNVDIQLTKTDGVTSYTPGNTVTYTINVSNNGPADANNITVGDVLPAQIGQWDWACTTVTSASGCDAVAGSQANFSDTVNIQDGGSITYTVTAYTLSSASASLDNTVTVSVPGGYNNTGDTSASDVTDTPSLVADLSVTNSDGHEAYLPNAVKTYTIVFSNNGPSDVTGASVLADLTNSNILSAAWTCSASGGATCPAANGSNDISHNNSVNLPAGSSLTYTATVTAVGSPSGNLVTTASITAPGGVTDAGGNNSATDTDVLIVSSGTSYGNIGTTPDGGGSGLTTLGANTSIVLTLSSPITVNGAHAGWDLGYFEEPNSGIQMDLITLEVSDGFNWYTILIWGDGYNALDDASSIANVCPGETDNCPISTTYLENFGSAYDSAVAIDLDHASLGIPNGTTVYYIRITTPPVDGDGAGMDAIYVVVP